MFRAACTIARLLRASQSRALIFFVPETEVKLICEEVRLPWRTFAHRCPCAALMLPVAPEVRTMGAGRHVGRDAAKVAQVAHLGWRDWPPAGLKNRE